MRVIGTALPRTSEATGEALVAANARIDLFRSDAMSRSNAMCNGKVQLSNVRTRIRKLEDSLQSGKQPTTQESGSARL